MGNLSSAPNIGEVLSNRLELAGINSPEELRTIGSKEAFLRVREVYPEACINHLYAIEGAVQNIRWHYLSNETKQELKAFYCSLSKGSTIVD